MGDKNGLARWLTCDSWVHGILTHQQLRKFNYSGKWGRKRSAKTRPHTPPYSSTRQDKTKLGVLSQRRCEISISYYSHLHHITSKLENKENMAGFGLSNWGSCFSHHCYDDVTYILVTTKQWDNRNWNRSSDLRKRYLEVFSHLYTGTFSNVKSCRLSGAFYLLLFWQVSHMFSFLTGLMLTAVEMDWRNTNIPLPILFSFLFSCVHVKPMTTKSAPRGNAEV